MCDRKVDATVYFKHLKYACVYKDTSHYEFVQVYKDLLSREKYINSSVHKVGDMALNFEKMYPLLQYLEDIPKNHKMSKRKIKAKVLNMNFNGGKNEKSI